MFYNTFISSQQLFIVFYIKLYIYIYIFNGLGLETWTKSHMSEYYNSRRLFCHRCSLKVCWCSSLLNIVFVCIFTC